MVAHLMGNALSVFHVMVDNMLVMYVMVNKYIVVDIVVDMVVMVNMVVNFLQMVNEIVAIMMVVDYLMGRICLESLAIRSAVGTGANNIRKDVTRTLGYNRHMGMCYSVAMCNTATVSDCDINTSAAKSTAKNCANSVAFKAKVSTMSCKWVTIDESYVVNQVRVVNKSAERNIVSAISMASYQNVLSIKKDTIAKDSVAFVDSMVDWIAVEKGIAINDATIVDIATVSASASFVGDSIYDNAMTIIGKLARNIYSNTHSQLSVMSHVSLMGQDSTNTRSMDRAAVSAVVVAMKGILRLSSAVV
jgi:hypothetical protein